MPWERAIAITWIQVVHSASAKVIAIGCSRLGTVTLAVPDRPPSSVPDGTS